MRETDTGDTHLDKAKNTRDFILKLAQDPNLSDEVAIATIAQQINSLMPNRHFLDVYSELNPSNYHSVTKCISQEARGRLNSALEKLVFPQEGE